ncbi:MAG: glycosyltransferase family 2 protein [Mucilaginibacter sp.]
MAVKIDIIILSNAKDDKLMGLTDQSITTLLASEDPQKISFDILVIESNKNIKPYNYAGVRTIYPDTVFGYNKYMNIGIKATRNDYVCLFKNDLVFHKGWASAILAAMDNDPDMISASPYCPIFHKNAGFDEDGPVREGYFGVLGGWCIFMKRKIFDIIGLFDEKLIFWYCDADYCKTLEKFGVKNCLVPASKVTHLGSESLKTVDEKEYQKLTQVPRVYYNYKWNHHSYLKYLAQTLLLRLKLLH